MDQRVKNTQKIPATTVNAVISVMFVIFFIAVLVLVSYCGG